MSFNKSFLCANCCILNANSSFVSVAFTQLSCLSHQTDVTGVDHITNNMASIPYFSSPLFDLPTMHILAMMAIVWYLPEQLSKLLQGRFSEFSRFFHLLVNYRVICEPWEPCTFSSTPLLCCRQDNGPISEPPTETELMARACHYHCPEICYEFDMQKLSIPL